MINLFNSLPVNVFTAMEDGMVALSCRFDDLKQNKDWEIANLGI
jgi:hypothetical protein